MLFFECSVFLPLPPQNSIQSPKLPDVVLEADGTSGSLDVGSGLSIVDVGSTSAVLVGSELGSDDVLSFGSSTVFDSFDVVVGDGDGDVISSDSLSLEDGVDMP